MKKQLLLLLIMGLLPIGMMAEGEFPNALVIHKTDGTEMAFQLEGTKLQLIYNDMVQVNAGNRDYNFDLSDISGVTYEYRDLGTQGIFGAILSNVAKVEVYGLDGCKMLSGVMTQQEVLRQLPKGIYVIKMNGKTLKIAK